MTRAGRWRSASIRLRLTLSYAGVFLAVGLLLVGSIFLLLRYQLQQDHGSIQEKMSAQLGISPTVLDQTIRDEDGRSQTVRTFLTGVQERAVNEALGALFRLSAIMLFVTAAVSLAIGWLLAGRMLRPVHEITTVARRLSASTLDERIGLEGPNDELKELADTFDAMLDRLGAAFAAQKEFVDNASHELRTPLAIMRTEVDVTLDDPEASPDDLRRMAATLREATARSEEIIDRLLTLARSEELTEREPLDLSEIVAEVLADYGAAAGLRRLDFARSLEPAPVVGDTALLDRLVANLVGNALRYAPEGGTITVRTAATAATATLVVANDGDPIPPEDLSRLFERFYRRDVSRARAGGGSGLGLAIVAAVATAHGGEVHAQSPTGGGLVVTVNLPAVRPGAAAA
jgi:signal transduction histidine kinase